MRVLVAEDDPISAKVLQRALEKLDYQPVLCSTGTDAWRMIEEDDFSIVITDWMMPGMEGPELCQRIRKITGRRYTYIIMLTGKGEKKDRLEAMAAGADDFLAKPLDKDDLDARLTVAKRILNMQKQMEAQNFELQAQRLDLQRSNLDLKSRQDELNTALQRLAQQTKIAEVSRNRFSQLFEGLPVPSFTYDTNLCLVEGNQITEAIFKRPLHLAMERPLLELLGKELFRKKQKMFADVFNGKSFESEDLSDGEQFLLASGYPLIGPDGSTVTGGICVVVDITRERLVELSLEKANVELQEASERLAKLATTDGLTGIPNHRGFLDRLEQLINEAKRGRPVSMVMLDVDHFKGFNDTFGHQAGDEVLFAVAQCMKQNIRASDFVARYGGEEFAVLFSDTTEDVAVGLAEKLRVAISEIVNPYKQITASFGVCSYGPHAPTGQLLSKCADKAMYWAKQNGRNRVAKASALSLEEVA